jgi:tRNA modification GTPase
MCYLESLINLRLYVEAAIDFPDEEIDFLSDGIVAARLQVCATMYKRF